MAPATALAREERKVVTVLFADLVGFTSRSEKLGLWDEAESTVDEFIAEAEAGPRAASFG